MAKTTIGFHPSGHKWFLAPDFSAIALGDDASISEAIDLVLRAKRKSVGTAERGQLVSKLSMAVGGETVGDLRAFDEDKWGKIDLPVLCRVYLKHLIQQSVVLTQQQLLECDFNSGLAFEMADYQAKLTQILQLGFSRNDAFEALVVTGNSQVDQAAQYLLTDKESRALERQGAKKRFGKSVPPNRHHTIIARARQEKAQMLQWVKKSQGQLELELAQLKRTLAGERMKTEEFTSKRDVLAKENQLVLYQEFLRGLISDPVVNGREIQRIETYRSQRKIDDKDHDAVLKKLNLNEKKFDEMKSFEDVGGGNEDECLVCYEPPRDHMIIPCHHVCLCGDCAGEYKEMGDEATCPLCDVGIKDIRQVYYF